MNEAMSRTFGIDLVPVFHRDAHVHLADGTGGTHAHSQSSRRDQVFQTNGNENDPRAGAGTCFGDSGGPAILNGFLVGDTSYGFTSNCRYLGGYQRVDIPVVRNWLLDCTADLVCPTKVT